MAWEQLFLHSIQGREKTHRLATKSQQKNLGGGDAIAAGGKINGQRVSNKRWHRAHTFLWLGKKSGKGGGSKNSFWWKGRESIDPNLQKCSESLGGPS